MVEIIFVSFLAVVLGLLFFSEIYKIKSCSVADMDSFGWLEQWRGKPLWPELAQDSLKKSDARALLSFLTLFLDYSYPE